MATATYIPIATQTLGSAASSITFSSIPSTYTDLRLVLVCTTNAVDNAQIQFNSDTATNYSQTTLYGAISTSFTSNTVLQWTAAGGTNTTNPSFYQMDIFSYAGSTNKTALLLSSEDNNGSGFVEIIVGLWRSTNAINRIDLKSGGTTFKAGTIATLWGI